jgi:hypothetical protein
MHKGIFVFLRPKGEIIQWLKHLAVRYTRFLIETMSEGCVCVANPFLRMVRRAIRSFETAKEVDLFSRQSTILQFAFPISSCGGGSSPPPIQEGPRLYAIRILSVQPTQSCGVACASLCSGKLHTCNTSADSVLNIFNTSRHMALSFERAVNSPDSCSYQSPRNIIAARLFMRQYASSNACFHYVCRGGEVSAR